MAVATIGSFFHEYWWLLFPLAFFIWGGWNSFMNYKQNAAKIEVLKAYAASGKEPPADLLASLEKTGGDGEGDDSGSWGFGTTVFLVVLFSGLAGVFYYVGDTGMLSDGVRETSFFFVAAILGVLAVAFLLSGIVGLFSGGKSKK